MTLRHQGKYTYGDGPEDLRAELTHYSETNSDPVTHFAEAVCNCGGRVFVLELDEGAGVGIFECVACDSEHVIDDRGRTVEEAYRYADDRNVCSCICNKSKFEIMGAVNTYIAYSDDARWFFLDCRCVSCGCLGCYGDWRADCAIQKMLGRV